MAEKHKIQSVEQSVSILGENLSKALAESLEKSTPKDKEATLSTLKEIFDNIIQHPNDDKYRQIKLTNKRFSSIMWRYPAAVNVMKMSGWEEDGDFVRLRNESDAKAISQLLEQELQKLREPTPTYQIEHANTDSSSASTNSSKCCVPLAEDIAQIVVAILNGDGQHLRELLSQYHVACVKNMPSVISCVCMSRQIGIARILATKYGVDFNSVGKEGSPYYELLFDGCDSSEKCQLLIIQFIKEFNIDVHRRCLSTLTALHFAILHKLFTVVKCLVEDREVDVNCVSVVANDGTSLHMAYGIGEENIAQYLIEHGADQDALDNDGRKPIDYKLYESSENYYACISQYFMQRRTLRKAPYILHEYTFFRQLCDQGLEEKLAMELTFKTFPSLQENLGDIVHHHDLGATPTLNALNPYITDMTPSYYDIGLQLGVARSTLNVIHSDTYLHNKQKCREMLQAWLQKDTSATWRKLCDALQEIELNALAEQIKKSL